MILSAHNARSPASKRCLAPPTWRSSGDVPDSSRHLTYTALMIASSASLESNVLLSRKLDRKLAARK